MDTTFCTTEIVNLSELFGTREMSKCLFYLKFRTGKVILESVVLTAAVVISLTLYTFWAAKRGHDFSFLGPFLFGAVIVLMLFAIIQVCGDFSTCIYFS